MKRYLTIALLALTLSACSDSIKISSHCDDVPVLVPDYAGVTIPPNIAPLCFGVEGLEQAALIIAGEHDSICLETADGCFNPSVGQWKRLMEQERGHSLRLTVCRPAAQGWEAMQPVSIQVSNDSIDPYLVYRRITPGYGLWNRMGIYQRDLESYDETSLYENRYGRGNCVNCHAFCQGDPDRWQVHVRFRQAGTYVMEGREQQRLNLEDKSHGNPVYANWHPDGRLVAYSTNKTFFLIHTLNRNRWEVMDEASDVMVTDVETGVSYRSPLTSSPSSFETYPCFSPDGRWLYFCSAEAPLDAEVVEHFDSIRYSVCRVSFEAATRSFGQQVDTVYNAQRDGGSASFPRISPDGRWLCFTRSEYGNFSICHRDADLCLVDLSQCPTTSISQSDLPQDFAMCNVPMPGFRVLSQANSDQVDSWHSWSRNSRWLVISSKRDDGIYTRPYFTHIDAEGNATKAFALPLRDAPRAYDLQMDCFNLPELVSGPVRAKLHPSGDRVLSQDSGVN